MSTLALDFRARRQFKPKYLWTVWTNLKPSIHNIHKLRARRLLWINPHYPRARRPGDSGRAHNPLENKRPAQCATRPPANPPANPYSIKARAFYRPLAHIAWGC